MKTSEQTNELFTALAKAQLEMGTAKEDGFNKHLGAGYASIDSLQAAYKEPLSKNGLAIIQNVYSEGELYFLETRLCHSSGQWMASSMRILLAKNDMQSLGAGVTYAKRYSITSILGISTEIDEEKLESTAKKSQDFGQRRALATENLNETKAKIEASKQVLNHATGEVREMPKVTEQAMKAAANPKTGTVAVTKLVEQFKSTGEMPPLPTTENVNWDFVISFGKHMGKTIRDLGFAEASRYADYLINAAGGKKLSPTAELFVKALRG